MGSNATSKAEKLRGQYNLVLSFRVRNNQEIEQLETKINYCSSDGRSRILLDQKKQYDHELQTELILLDTEINNLLCPKLF